MGIVHTMVTILRDWHRCRPEVVSLLRGGALGMSRHPEGALATEGSRGVLGCVSRTRILQSLRLPQNDSASLLPKLEYSL